MSCSVHPAEGVTEESFFETLIQEQQFEREYRECGRSFDRKVLLQNFYRKITTEIRSIPASVWVNVYPCDWDFNANERQLWDSIRRRPMVLYPEFPVLNYFVDFGHPSLQIALEADSKQFHNQESDTKRDMRLLDNGWLVFRVPYAENFRGFVELGDIAEMIDRGDEDTASDALQHWLLYTGDGVVEALYFRFFMTDEQRVRRDDKYPGFSDLVERTLKIHRLVS